MRLLLIPIAFAACVADPGPEEPFASAGSAGTTGAAAEAGRGGAPATAGAGGKASGAGAAGKVSAGGAAGGKAGSSGKTAAGSGGTSNASGGPQGGSPAAAGGQASGAGGGALPDYCLAPTPIGPGSGCTSTGGTILQCGAQCGTLPVYHACINKQNAPLPQAGACQSVGSDTAGIVVVCCESLSCFQSEIDCPEIPGALWYCPIGIKPPRPDCEQRPGVTSHWCCK